jgi:hypothetical protein
MTSVDEPAVTVSVVEPSIVCDDVVEIVWLEESMFLNVYRFVFATAVGSVGAPLAPINTR